MGLLLFDAFEDEPVVEPEVEFVRAATGRTVVHGYGSDVRVFLTKDPDEIDFVNFDFTRSLGLVSDTLDEVVGVELDEGDEALLVDQIAESSGVVSVRWQGGTEGTGYTVRARVTTTGGRTWDLSGYVFIAPH